LSSPIESRRLKVRYSVSILTNRWGHDLFNPRSATCHLHDLRYLSTQVSCAQRPGSDRTVAAAGVRLARGRTNMWDCWLGFNLSHSLGAIIFGLVCISTGFFARSLAVPKATLLVPILVGVIYFLLAIRFWFRTPAVVIAIGTGLLFLGWMSY
jgi:hypothetical protein